MCPPSPMETVAGCETLATNSAPSGNLRKAGAEQKWIAAIGNVVSPIAHHRFAAKEQAYAAFLDHAGGIDRNRKGKHQPGRRVTQFR